MSRNLTVTGGPMADCHDRAIGFLSTFLRRLVDAAGRSRRFSGVGSTGGQHRNRGDGSSQEQKMRFWRWILVALVVLTLGSVLSPTTSSAADRSARFFWVDGAGPSGEPGSGLTGDPDGGGGYSG